jgi:hypothetical protein
MLVSAIMSLSATTDALALGEPLRVSARDLALQPHKVFGKEIEVELRCAITGESRYRCAAPNLRLDLNRISNDEGRALIQRYCKDKQDAARPRCLLKLRFVSDGGRRDAQGLTQIRARDDTAVIVMRGVRSD